MPSVVESLRLRFGYQGFKPPPSAATASVASKAEMRVARWNISTTSKSGN
jgi:hypothetical protein